VGWKLELELELESLGAGSELPNEALEF